MTPDEHAAEAEALVAALSHHNLDDPDERALSAVWMQAAQVHAILSLRQAAPTVTSSFQDGPAGPPETLITADSRSALGHKPDFDTARGHVPHNEVVDYPETEG